MGLKRFQKSIWLFAAFLTLASFGLAQRTDRQASIMFSDVTSRSGVNVSQIADPEKRYIVESMSGGVALLDCDEDGLLDIAAVRGSSVARFRKGGDQFFDLYRQVGSKDSRGIPRFANITGPSGIGKKGWGMGITAVDYDNDGLIDIFVTGFKGNAVFRGVGKCRFEDATERSGLSGGGFNTGAAWADFDRDGHLDVFVAGYVSLELDDLPKFGSSKTCSFRMISVQCGPRGLPGESDQFYRNRGDGTFEEVSKKVGTADPDRYFGLTPVWGDYDNDGWPDLFVANDATPDYLYRNKGDGTLEEVGFEQGVAFSDRGREQGSMGVTWGDYDLDGDLDLFVSDFETETNALYRNLGEGKGFLDVTMIARIGLASRPYVGWGTAFEDFDNDGWPDLLVVNGHVYPQLGLAPESSQYFGYGQHFLLFRNLGNGAFSEISTSAGLRKLPLLSRRGAAFGDLNNDGRVDTVVSNLGELPTILLNTTWKVGDALTLKLVRKGPNRQAIMARATVTTTKRKLIREVTAGSSYISQNDLRIHFGLGTGEAIRSVDIRWSDGTVERVKGVRKNTIAVIKKGVGVFSSKPYSSFAEE